MSLPLRKTPRRDDQLSLTGIERPFATHELIVTKTDLKGHITYANDVFLRLAGYTENQVMGAAHSLIRHPHMPHGVFKLLWDTLKARKEIFAYVLNRSANGDHYWVLAHVTPSYDQNGVPVGYHSNRRVADKQVLKTVIEPLYAATRQAEGAGRTPPEKAMLGFNFLVNALQSQGKTYDEFIFGLVK